MIVFAAYVPHSPFLIDKIGKEKTQALKKSVKALKKVEEHLYAVHPDVVVFIGGHSNVLINAFSMSFAPRFKTSFKDVGDFQMSLEFGADLGLAQQIKESFMKESPIILNSDPYLDYALSVPIHLLMSRMPQKKIVALHHSMETPMAHFEFGARLRDVFEHSGKRVAIIASGDLSHCLAPDAPGGFSEYGKAFDDVVKQQIKRPPYKKLLNLGPDFLGKAQECGVRQLAILLGVLSEHYYQAEQLSYEHPFGVGYLTAQFIIR